jgi:hypothetical protein
MIPIDPKHEVAAAAATSESASWTPRKQDAGKTDGWTFRTAPVVPLAHPIEQPKDGDSGWLQPGSPTGSSSGTTQPPIDIRPDPAPFPERNPHP